MSHKTTDDRGTGRRPKRPQDWTAEERLQAVMDTAEMDEQELGAYLRRNGLHKTHLEQWRNSAMEALSGKSSARQKKRSAEDAKTIKKLEREVRRKDKALAEASALLILKKKVQEIWGDEDDDTPPSKGG